MSVPKKRHTKSAVGMRRSHHALKAINLHKCPKCSRPMRSHRACLFCGFYKDSEVIKTTKKVKKEK